MTNSREINIAIFQDTRSMYTTDPVLKGSVEASVKGQRLFREADPLSAITRQAEEDCRDTTGSIGSDLPIGETGNRGESQPETKGRVLVSKKRTLEAAAAYHGKKVCVHNFASATNPGGGVTRGSSAQEEALCRCSTLYPCLTQESLCTEFYQAHRRLPYTAYNDDCIYTPDVVVFKRDMPKPQAMPKEDWYLVNVITCAAPNLRMKPGNAMNPGGGKRPKLTEKELFELHMKRGRRILDVAHAYGNEVVVLGAFGCGAFQNPPETVAHAYAELMKEYRNLFETIEFAVYCRGNETRNHETFFRRMKPLMQQ